MKEKIYLPLGYESLAFVALPPSPQLSKSPGRHRSPVPIAGCQLLWRSLVNLNIFE